MLKLQQPPAEKAIQEEPIAQQEPHETSDAFKVNLALGTLTLVLSVGLLYILNRFIFLNYDPDVKELVNQALSWSLKPAWEFAPEPVERLQFQLTLVTLPLFIYISYLITKPLKNVLKQKPIMSFWVNVAGINIFLVWLLVIFIQGSSPDFLKSSLFGRLGLIAGIIFYSAVAFVFLRSAKIQEGKKLKILLHVISFEIVALILLNILLYNWFNVSELQRGHLEVNVVLYPLTQILAGKSLLVDLNSQYGLYAWFLAPFFRCIGLSAQKFAMVMGVMNAASFLFIFLGLRKMIRQNLLCLIVFLALVYWQYWFVKIPFENMSRHYFQYWPIRIFFPALAFYLITLYFAGSQRSKKTVLLLLSFTASFAVLWNFDSGFVVYGAVFISLIYSAFSGDQVFRNILKYTLYMLISLGIAASIFIISTYLRSGAIPDFIRMIEYQQIFYISGYNMIAMEPIHFWHLPALVYIISCFYCIFHLKNQGYSNNPVIAFLFLLGCGLFAYFQGRSYSANVTIVMYPAIILLGIFSAMIFNSIEQYKLKLHPAMFLFFLSFTVLADGAFSMLEHIPDIQSRSWKNAFPERLVGEQWLKKRQEFITGNFRQNDTVIILSKNFESFYYTEGLYYNPVNIPSSTEMFRKSDLDSLLSAIKRRKYTVFFDSSMVVDGAETIAKVLSENAYVSKRHPDRDLIIYRPKKLIPNN